jgi:hypothetical protein
MTGARITDSSEDLAEIDWKRVERLEWTQPGVFARRWELHADGALAARMHWRGIWKRGYDAQTSGGSWRIEEPLFRPVKIHRLGEDSELASARAGIFAPVHIDRAAGEALEWRTLSLRKRVDALTNAERFPLFELRSGFHWFRAGAALHLEDSGHALPDIEALVLLAWALKMISRSHQNT